MAVNTKQYRTLKCLDDSSEAHSPINVLSMIVVGPKSDDEHDKRLRHLF